MKRIVLIAALLFLALSTYGDSRLSISPSEMKNGETKTLVDGDRTIKVTRDGDDLTIKIEGAGKTRTITIANGASGDVTISRDGHHFRIPDGDFVPPRIFIDRSEIERKLLRPHAQSLFICPKDHTVLRVPEDQADKTYKCPVDGTTMEKKKARGFGIFMDEFPHEDL